VHVM